MHLRALSPVSERAADYEQGIDDTDSHLSGEG